MNAEARKNIETMLETLAAAAAPIAGGSKGIPAASAAIDVNQMIENVQYELSDFGDDSAHVISASFSARFREINFVTGDNTFADKLITETKSL